MVRYASMCSEFDRLSDLVSMKVSAFASMLDPFEFPFW